MGDRARGETLLLWVALVALAAFATVGLFAVAYPYQLSYVEGYLLEQGVRLAEGDALYRPLGGPAWIVDNFPPLYPLAVAAGVEVFGASFWFGRLLTLGAVAGLASVASVWHRRRGHSGVVALGLVTLWLLSPYVIRRAMLLRMDFAAILLAALGLMAYLYLHDRRPGLAAPTSALLFAAALGVRQTMLAAPAALIVMLLAQRRGRDAAVLLGILTAIGAAAVVILQHLTDGLFLRHVLDYNSGRYLFDQYLVRLGRTFSNQPILMPLGIIGAVVAWRSGRFTDRVVALWGLLALAMTLTAGKPGSTYNHFLETLFIAGLLAGVALPRLLAWLRTHVNRTPRAPGALAVLVFVMIVVAAIATPTQTARSTLDAREEDASLVALLSDTHGPILSENAGALVLAGHAVLLEPRTMLELHHSNEWDDAALVDSVEAQNYTLLMLETFRGPHLCTLGCRFTDDTWTAIQTHYTPSETIGRWQVWRPTPA